MKDFDINDIKEKTQLSVKQQKEEERELVLINQIIPHRGHKVWEVDKNGNVKEAEYSECDWVFNGMNTPKIIINEGCFYTSALNKKNALSNFRKGKVGGIPINKNGLTL